MPKKNTKLDMLHRTSSAIELVQWSAPSVLAFQTTRHHPKITTDTSLYSPYNAFNLGLHVDDDEIVVNANRSYIEQNLIAGKKIQWLEQVHGSDVAIVSYVNEQPIVADACITENKNIALAIMTADCLPILLCNTQGTKVGAVHGGWRSLAGNILENIVTKMAVDANELQAWLGPCIGRDAFEVGVDVYDAFVLQSKQFEKAFKIHKSGKYLADLHLIAKIQLKSLGVKKINILDECTFDNSNKYYSYRKHSITGRMATIICLI
jgi:YfiH family protein